MIKCIYECLRLIACGSVISLLQTYVNVLVYIRIQTKKMLTQNHLIAVTRTIEKYRILCIGIEKDIDRYFRYKIKDKTM